MTKVEFQKRTKEYAKRVINLVDALPRRRSCEVLGNQLLRCATSVGANYRSACRSRSSKEFCSKLGIAEEEADESLYWMELLVECNFMPSKRLLPLLKEGNEILSMIVASIRTARRNQ